MTVLQRYAPAAAPVLFAAAWAVVLAVLSIPSVMDWRLILLIVLLGGAVGGLQTTALVAPRLREWGIGAGILGAMLAPFGMGVTVLSLFTYRSGDLGPGWGQSETVLPALAVQVLAAAVVITGLAIQRTGATPARHRRGRWLVLAGTLIGTSVLAAHLCAVAFDAVAAS
jgi:hypothetical protein